MQQVVQQWTYSDPSAAANWINRFPAGDLRDSAVPELVGNWTKRDPAAAEKFLATLPDDKAR